MRELVFWVGLPRKASPHGKEIPRGLGGWKEQNYSQAQCPRGSWVGPSCLREEDHPPGLPLKQPLSASPLSLTASTHGLQALPSVPSSALHYTAISYPQVSASLSRMLTMGQEALTLLQGEASEPLVVSTTLIPNWQPGVCPLCPVSFLGSLHATVCALSYH